MATFFELIFPELNKTENQVCCPFPHYTTDGQEYYETHPSAGINIEKNVFHCFSCNRSYSENQFIENYMEISPTEANILKMALATNQDIDYWDNLRCFQNEQTKEYVIKDLGISEKVIEQLKIKLSGNSDYEIEFPLFLFDKLVDVTNYKHGREPKVYRRKGSVSGLISPYDLWRFDTNHPTLICAGEKDMAIARTKGFNAITITGGEGYLPKFFGRDFRDREIFIIYDNDTVGKKGAINVANYISKFTSKIKIIDLSDICTEKGEDLWDYFMKYKKTAKDLVNKIRQTPWYDATNHIQNEYKMLSSLTEGTKPENFNKIVKCNVQVVATLDIQYALPISITATKTANDGGEENNTMSVGDTKVWELTEQNTKDMLYLIDNKLTESKIYSNMRELLFIPKKESAIKITVDKQQTVYRCTVTDFFETTDDSNNVLEQDAYCIGTQLESGKKYKIKYTLVPHPYNGNKLTMIILDAESAEDTVDNFKLTEHKKELLKQFQVGPNQTLESKMDDLIEKVKGIVNADYNSTLLKTIDLWYNTPLYFKVGNSTPLRATLDTILVAESRVGKSTTAAALKKLYGLGATVSFAGASATEAGLIGGSKLVNGNYQTKAGIIPQMHKNAIIFEELGKANSDIIKTLTDVRSSGSVRITRVSGFFELPAVVRMLSLTNTKAGKRPKPISSYPNGIEILTELIGTPEDIARYDVMCIIGDKGVKEIDPFYEPQTPYSQESYQARIRWIWSRKTEDIIISKSVYSLAIKKANELNKEFNSYIKIFGTEAWQKIMRVAIAVAGYTVSTNEEFTQIIVKEEHIMYAVNFLRNLYDNSTFRFKEFVKEELSYTEINNESVKVLQELYVKHPAMYEHLEGNAETNKANLMAIAGIPQDEFNAMTSRLVALKFIKFMGYEIVPTERFRKCMSQIDKRIRLERLGEGDNAKN